MRIRARVYCAFRIAYSQEFSFSLFSWELFPRKCNTAIDRKWNRYFRVGGWMNGWVDWLRRLQLRCQNWQAFTSTRHSCILRGFPLLVVEVTIKMQWFFPRSLACCQNDNVHIHCSSLCLLHEAKATKQQRQNRKERKTFPSNEWLDDGHLDGLARLWRETQQVQWIVLIDRWIDDCWSKCPNLLAGAEQDDDREKKPATNRVRKRGNLDASRLQVLSRLHGSITRSIIFTESESGFAARKKTKNGFAFFATKLWSRKKKEDWRRWRRKTWNEYTYWLVRLVEEDKV